MASEPSLGSPVNGASRPIRARSSTRTSAKSPQFGALSWQHSAGALDVQSSFIARYSSLTFIPDSRGDLLFTGIAQDAYKQNVAYAAQSDARLRLNDSPHDPGGAVPADAIIRSATPPPQVLQTDTLRGCRSAMCRRPSSTTAAKTEWIYSAYLQDEWKLAPDFTVNYGLRFDKFTAYTSGNQVSPRLNMVWKVCRTRRCTPGIRATSRRRPSSWWAARTSRCLPDTTTAAPLVRRRCAAAGREGELLRPRRPAKDHSRVHGRSRHLLQAIGESDR